MNGGAFALRNQPVVRATNVTITGNTAAGTGGVLHNGTIPAPGVASFELANTIAAGNLAAGLPSGCAGTAPPGSVVSLGNNVEPTASCGAPAAGDTTADPQLGPLAANGGPTLTHAIASTSPAKDTANAARCPATDQRGIARPQFAGCDIGAFELAPAPPRPACGDAAPTRREARGRRLRLVRAPAVDEEVRQPAVVPHPPARAEGRGRQLGGDPAERQARAARSSARASRPRSTCATCPRGGSR